ncbi:hypothetical protein BGZ76_001860 [Entomortierella beljakovae]|nr:hypothetical protein BGZ76_001860 [Entomortierella beljakovae]
MFPYSAKETIPVWGLGVLAVGFPFVIIAAVGLGIRRSPYDFHNGVLGLLVSVLLTTIFTQVVKVTVGKHRPDFLSRCQPMLNGAAITHDEPLHLWTIDVCTQPDHEILKDGFRAFPSGHSSTSFAGLFYLSLWLGGKMHPFDRRGYSLKGIILVVPVLAAMLIAITRVQDYRHAAIDVTWGGIIGIIFAIFAYHQYYPAIYAKKSHIPHPPRDFSYLIKDTEGNSQAPGQFEHITGIARNDSFVDETGDGPEQLGSLERNGDDNNKPQDASTMV